MDERATTVVLWKEVRAHDDEDGSEVGDGRRSVHRSGRPGGNADA
jgi:hypothetical protein